MFGLIDDAVSWIADAAGGVFDYASTGISDLFSASTTDVAKLFGKGTFEDIVSVLGGKGGVAGIIFWPYLRVDTQPMAIDVIQHIEHAINVAGEDHVGLGTDAGIAPIDRTAEWEAENREWVAYAVEARAWAERGHLDLYAPATPHVLIDAVSLVDRGIAQRQARDAENAKRRTAAAPPSKPDE